MLCCCIGSLALPPAPAQEQPEGVAPLTAAELAQRPDIWPFECAVLRAVRLGSESIAKGDIAVVGLVTATEVELGFSRVRSTVPIDQTDLLQRADAAWQKLTAEQRALDCASLAQRADLWPDRLRLVADFEWTADGLPHKLARGTELALGIFDGSAVRARPLVRADLTLPPIPIFKVDFAAQARAALVDPARAKTHRVLRELDGKVVHAKTGKKAKLQADRPPDYVVLYFSAGWCGPCREFSPN